MYPPDENITTSKYDLDLLFTLQNEKKFTDLFANFKKQANQCHIKMKEFIGSMYCNVCSPNVATMMENNKLKIHIFTCRDIIKSCNDTWNLAYTLTHVFNIYQIFNKVLKGHIAGNDVNITYNGYELDTCRKSGYYSYLMRQIDEFRDKNNILLIMDPDNTLCRSLLIYHRQFREVFGSKVILDEFKAEFASSKNVIIPSIDQPYKTDAEREAIFKTLSLDAETKVTHFQF